MTWLNKKLDKIGFDDLQTKKRLHDRRKQSVAKDKAEKRISSGDLIETIFAGSHADGTGFNHCNDLDVLKVICTVICQIDEHFIDDGQVVFQMVYRTSSPGYTYLKLINEGNADNFKIIEDALVDIDGERYLSSEKFKTIIDHACRYHDNKGWIGKSTKHRPPVGPSVPKCIHQSPQQKDILSSLQLKSYDTDVVWAFRCKAGPILDAWRNRKRKYGWLKKKMIAKVARLPAHVVPVGQKGTKDEHLQWRICFTLGEIHLVKNFSNVQRKIYVLMKLIAKHFLKPVCNDVSSYVIKNVIFWISEENQTGKFNEKNLIPTLQIALRYLLKSIKNKHLRNYMIPERNLFEGKFEDDNQAHHKLITAVKQCINEPEKTVLEMKPSLLELERASLIDGDERMILEPLTTIQLTDMYVKMTTCKTMEDILLLNIQYKAIPFLKRWDLGLECELSAFDVWQHAVKKLM